MPDNKPRENKFLQQNQAAQFVKSSSDMLSQNIGKFFANTAKAYVYNTDVQIDSGQTLKRIDRSLTTISDTLLIQNKMLEKSNAEALRLQMQTQKFISNKSVTTTQKRKTAKDFIQKKDPDEGMRKNIGDIEGVLLGIRKDGKEKSEKKSSIFSTLLKGFGIGGLIGYLLTGKGEMVTELRAGIKQSMISVWGFISNWYSEGGGKELLIDTGKAIAGGITKAVKWSLSTIWDNKESIVKTMWKHKGLIGGGLIGMLLTGKTGLLGPLVKTMGKGLFGVLKHAIVPALKFAFMNPALLGVLGAAIWSGTKLFKLGKAIADGMESRKEAKRMKSEVIKSGTSAAYERAKRLNFDKKTTETYMENHKSINLITRMMGDETGIGAGIGADMLINKHSNLPLMKKWKKKRGFFGLSEDEKSQFAQEALIYFNKQNQNIIKSNKDKGGDEISVKSNHSTEFTPDMFGFKNGKVGLADEYHSSIYEDGGIKDPRKQGSKYYGVVLNENPNIAGLQPKMKNGFLAMAKEYYDLTGDSIQVNSAKRNGSKRSSHNFGWAIDMQSVDANALENMGLMKKYGFHRPLKNYVNSKGKKETWHVEPYPGKDVYGPRDTINNEFRIPTLMKGNPTQVGGDEYNLPRGNVESKLKSDTPMQVSLSDGDIDRLVAGFGEELRRNKPEVASASSMQAMSGRKL